MFKLGTKQDYYVWLLDMTFDNTGMHLLGFTVLFLLKVQDPEELILVNQFQL